MLKKLFFLLLLTLSLIQIVEASLEVTPSPLSIQLEAGVPKNITINFTNRFNVTIYNITYQNPKYFTNIIVEELQPNQSIVKQVQFLANTQIAETINSRVIFTYLGILTEPPKVWLINMTAEDGFKPKHLAIRQNDVITWFNSDNITRGVTSSTAPVYFDTFIPSLNSYSFTFTNIGSYPYKDKVIPLYTGSVNVVNASTPIQLYNPNFDAQHTIIINSQFIQTNILFELFQENFEIKYNGANEGLLKVTNIGNLTALNITLTSTSNWVSFLENKFSLNPSENNFVNFRITPIITEAASTGKNYTIPIVVSGLNTPSITKSIRVFIPQETFVVGNDTSKEELIKLLAQAQELIKRLNLTNGSKEVIYLPASLAVNFTEEEILRLLRTQANVDTKLERIEQRRGTDSDTIKGISEIIAQLQTLANGTMVEQERIRENVDFQNAFALWSVIVIIVVSGGAWIHYTIRKKAIEGRRIPFQGQK